jgi:hypothetical protein
MGGGLLLERELRSCSSYMLRFSLNARLRVHASARGAPLIVSIASVAIGCPLKDLRI